MSIARVVGVCSARKRQPSRQQHQPRSGALLSILDEPWCRAALLKATAEGSDPSSKRLLVGFLLHSEHRDTRRRAARLLPPPPELGHGTMGYTREEVVFRNLRQDVERYRERARTTAALLRPS